MKNNQYCSKRLRGKGGTVEGVSLVCVLKLNHSGECDPDVHEIIVSVNGEVALKPILFVNEDG